MTAAALQAALDAGDIRAAERLLGGPYLLGGRVVHGKKLGRRLGAPTANIPLAVAPTRGTFAALAGGVGLPERAALAHIGVRPTVDTAGAPMLEVFLLDFEGDLYGQRLQVRLLQKVRDEARLAGFDELKVRVRENVALVRAYFQRNPMPVAPAPHGAPSGDSDHE